MVSVKADTEWTNFHIKSYHGNSELNFPKLKCLLIMKKQFIKSTYYACGKYLKEVSQNAYHINSKPLCRK